jgi:hypothetical protein
MFCAEYQIFGILDRAQKPSNPNEILDSPNDEEARFLRLISQESSNKIATGKQASLFIPALPCL